MSSPDNIEDKHLSLTRSQSERLLRARRDYRLIRMPRGSRNILTEVLNEESSAEDEEFPESSSPMVAQRKQKIEQQSEGSHVVDQNRHGCASPVASLNIKLTKAISSYDHSSNGEEFQFQLHLIPSVYSLPTVRNVRFATNAFQCIDPMVLLNCLQSSQLCGKYVLIDCRFPYEYNGGHILNAINIFDKEMLDDYFFTADGENSAAVHNKTPIFYCEHSSVRAPNLASRVRSVDRLRHSLAYPRVAYPEIYILHHGYSNFFSIEECKQYCEPPAYVTMDDPLYKVQLGIHSRSGSGSRRTWLG